jgi:hypothetical protein
MPMNCCACARSSAYLSTVSLPFTLKHRLSGLDDFVLLFGLKLQRQITIFKLSDSNAAHLASYYIRTCDEAYLKRWRFDNPAETIEVIRLAERTSR